MNEALVFVIVLPTLFITIGYVLTTIARSISRARRDRCNLEVQLRLLDRLGNGPDILRHNLLRRLHQHLTGPGQARPQEVAVERERDMTDAACERRARLKVGLP